MFAAASHVITPIKSQLFENRNTIVGLCLGACVYAAVANKYLHYVSDAYLFGRKPENIFYKFAGDWIKWGLEDKSIIFSSAVWFVALVGDSLRCLEQSSRVTMAIQELYLAAPGYNALCKERRKLSNRSLSWIPLSIKARTYTQGSRAYYYSINQLKRTINVTSELICLAAYIGDFLSTFMWTPESQPRSGSRLLINIQEARSKLMSDPEDTVKMLQKNETFMNSLFVSCKSPVDLKTYYGWVKPCADVMRVGNTFFSPIAPWVNAITNIAVQGAKVFASRFGVDVSSPTKETTKGSPFSNFSERPKKPEEYSLKVDPKRRLWFDD